MEAPQYIFIWGGIVLYFISAVYNEKDEIYDLINSVWPIVDGYRIVDDSSTDGTSEILKMLAHDSLYDYKFKTIPHTGLPETVKNEAKEMVPDGAWILMLDADERLTPETILSIQDFFDTAEDDDWDYIYFNQMEIIDNKHVRTFQKCKLFRKENVQFPLNNIHADDQFTGRGTYRDDWVVHHRKSSTKQIKREIEYLDTYKKLLDEGKIDQGRFDWLRNLHHYVK